MFTYDEGLRVRDLPLWLDSRRPRPWSFISHAHSDHLGRHDRVICTPETARLATLRTRIERADILSIKARNELEPGFDFTLLHAGHVLGSAMLHVAGGCESLLYTGDFKLRPSLTVPQADPMPADVLVMECTFGLPHFKFPPWRDVADQLVGRVAGALREGRQPVVMGYALGKAQEIVRILTDAGIPVTEHGAVARMSDVYEACGVPLGPRRRYKSEDFHGPHALDLLERGALVAPPQVARAAFTSKFDQRYTVMLTGWALNKGAKYMYGVDDCLPLSDHADFDELVRLVEIVNPKKVYTHHGYEAFADHLRARGWNAETAKPQAQLRLFD